MKVKVSELTGRPLSYAVAVCEYGQATEVKGEGYYWKIEMGIYARVGKKTRGKTYELKLQKDWALTGPLIEKHSINLRWEVTYWLSDIACESVQYGSTPLVAACRTIVCHRFGDVIDIPDELCEVV